MAVHPYNKKSQWRNISFSKPNKKLIYSVYPILETRFSHKVALPFKNSLPQSITALFTKPPPTELTYVSKQRTRIPRVKTPIPILL